jgi:short-subunit dehydrogenase
MRELGHGVIINVTSSVTLGVMPLTAIYAASKCAVEGFTESLGYELAPFNIKARLVEPGLAPTTAFAANTGPRMEGLLPKDYDAFTQAFFGKMANYPTPYCTEAEAAEAVYLAATDEGDRVRFPAGEDSKLLAKLRWTTSEEHYRAQIREMFVPAIA